MSNRNAVRKLLLNRAQLPNSSIENKALAVAMATGTRAFRNESRAVSKAGRNQLRASLYDSIRKGKTRAVAAFVADASNVRGKNAEFAMKLAITYRNIGAVRLLIDAGFDPNAWLRAASDHTYDLRPLTLAADVDWRGDIVKLLLDRGADPNLPDAIGYTPLMSAARNSDDGHHFHDDVVKILLEAGADPNVRLGRHNDTALTLAAASCQVNIVRMLLEAGADHKIMDGHMWTARDWARHDCHVPSSREKILRLLKRAARRS